MSEIAAYLDELQIEDRYTRQKYMKLIKRLDSVDLTFIRSKQQQARNQQ